MLGWINQMIQAFVVETFGQDAWEQIKEKAGVNTNWVSTCPYSDSMTYS